MSFDSLGLSEEILRSIAQQGYTEPTPIQKEAIPLVLAGKDLLAGAQTGTGKTAGFALPILELLSRTSQSKGHRPVRALILTPTRELAAQILESVLAYGRFLKLNSTVIFGGVKLGPQIDRLRGGVDILIATPGRLLDHLRQKTLTLSHLEILVLDEADRMLDMGFIHDIRRIMKFLPSKRQNLLFSATYSPDIKELAEKILHQPVSIQVARKNVAADNITQLVYPVDKVRKRELLSYLIRKENWGQVLVFTRTKHGANRLAEQLEKDGFPSSAIHGNKSQAARTKALAGFKDGKVKILVATDIAARGIDIDDLPHVVNFELPNVPEDYVHRIGRTGRTGRSGHATSLVCVDELDLLRKIEHFLRLQIPQEVLLGFEVDPSIKAEPIQMGKRSSFTSQGRKPNSGYNKGSSYRDGGSTRNNHSSHRGAPKSTNRKNSI